MNSTWTEEILSRYPEKYEQLNDSTYIIRRNITKETDEQGNVFYRCECKTITKDEYSNMIDSDFNNKFLIIMEAIADIYEKLEV